MTSQDRPAAAEPPDAEVLSPPRPAGTAFGLHVQDFLAEHLIDLSRAFDGDMQQMLILAVLGRMHLRARLLGAWAPPAPPPSISASRLAELTAIPRQTVRRKLLAMKAKGWIDQDPGQAWRLTMRDGRSNVLCSLGGIDARAIGRATRLANLYHPPADDYSRSL